MVLKQKALALPRVALLQHQVLLAEVLLEWVMVVLLRMVLLVAMLKYLLQLME